MRNTDLVAKRIVDGIRFWSFLGVCSLSIVWLYLLILLTHGPELLALILKHTFIPIGAVIVIALSFGQKMRTLSWFKISIWSYLLSFLFMTMHSMPVQAVLQVFYSLAIFFSILCIGTTLDARECNRHMVRMCFVLLIGTLVLLNTTVPREHLMFTEQGVSYTDRTRFFVSPFKHVQPMEQAPAFGGVVPLNNIPIGWDVRATYLLENIEAPDSNHLLALRTILQEGVPVPWYCFDKNVVSNEATQEFLELSYPGFSFNSVVKRNN